MDYDGLARLCEHESDLTSAEMIDEDAWRSALDEICETAEVVWSEPVTSFACVLARAQIANALIDHDSASPAGRAVTELVRSVLEIARHEGFAR